MTKLIRNILVFTLFVGVLAQSEQAPDDYLNENPLSAQLSESPIKVSPGQKTQLKINIELDKYYKAYLDKFKFSIKEPSSVKVDSFEIQPVINFFDPLSQNYRNGFQGKGEVLAEVRVPQDQKVGSFDVEFNLGYQACTTKHCLFPKTVSLSTQFIVTDQVATVPLGTVNGDWSFERALSFGRFFTFLFVFIAGVLTSLTPCVYPMIPITLAVLGNNNKSRSHLSGFLLSFTYVTGIGLMFSSLGVLAATSGMLFGSLLAHPAVIIFVSLVFFLMALSMFGVFEINIPPRLQERLVTFKTHGKFLTALFAGLVSGLVAAPCVGPVIISILTHVAQTKDVVYGFTLLFTYSLGMGILFLAIGTFSQLTRYLPRSGLWMKSVKYVFATIMVLMSIYYLYPVLQPQKNVQSRASDLQALNISIYSAEAFATAIAEKKPIILDFYADWCAACKELEEKTYVDPEILKLTRDAVFLQYDATVESAELGELRRKYDIKGLPSVIFISNEGVWYRELTLTGFEGPAEFKIRLCKVPGVRC
ncbi:MAG: cytochrome c biogenesis protein CcdA [Pseudomonadota bacterium]|nr:cytochrome c biogenesis protein CcdA [Pseudomonadota bacterium]